MQTTSERLQQIMKDRGLKQVDILNLVLPYCKIHNVKMNRSDISQYVSGKVTPGQTKLFVLARALGVDEMWLMGADVPMVRPSSKDNTNVDIDNVVHVDASTFVPIPVVGSAALGVTCYADMDIVDYEYVPRDMIDDSETYVFLSAIGDSMYPSILDGDRVLVRLQTSVDSGSTAVLIIDGQDMVIKQVKYGGDWIELHSTNPMYQVRRFEGKEVLRVSVYGLVKRVIRNFN